MFGFHFQQPVVHFTLTNILQFVLLERKRTTIAQKFGMNLQNPWSLRCNLLLAKLGLIGEEDATVLSKMSKKLPNDLPNSGHSLCDVIKLSDINHIKKNFTGNLMESGNQNGKAMG